LFAFRQAESLRRGGYAAGVPDASTLTSVLVADDDDQLLQLCSRLLTRAGYVVLRASDSDEALRVFHENSASICSVVLDATLEPGGAAALFEEMARVRDDLHAIFTGGEAPAPPLRELIENQRGVFLHKPFPGAALVRAVANDRP
jgi:two-component system cell cycle sensor histidine kinase/response regulator CckA